MFENIRYKLTIKNRLIIIYAMFLGLFILTSTFTYVKTRPLIVEFENHLEKVDHREDILTAIISAMGYGGAIHHFKNYLLRHSKTYSNQYLISHKKVNKFIKEYRSLQDITEAENKAINDIFMVNKLYLDAHNSAASMIKLGLTNIQIDKVIKVDDKPAFSAFYLKTA